MIPFLEIQNEILTLLKQREDDLIRIRNSTDPLIEKWQRFLNVTLPIQVMVARKHGFPANQKGLSDFNHQLMEAARSDPKLAESNREKWKYLFKTTFGFEEVKEITLEEARTLIKDISQAMTSEAFLSKIDNLMASHRDDSMIEKRKKLLEILLPLQMEVMGKHGFHGEDGYVQAQRALMDHFHDPEIIKEAETAQSIFFKRANLM